MWESLKPRWMGFSIILFTTAYVSVPVDSLLGITHDEAYIPVRLRVSDGSDYFLTGYYISEESDTTLWRCNLRGYIFKR